MDARRPCPDSALLAAFLDGALSDYERTAVVTHLSECSLCRAVALTVVELREVQALDEIWHSDTAQEDEARPTTRVARWTSEKTRAPALAIVALGVLIGIVAASPYLIQSLSPAAPTVAGLVTAADGQRLTHARLSDGFAFAAPARSSTTPAPGARLIAAANRVRENYGTDYGADGRRAVGVAALLVGELNDAVTSLSVASVAAPRNGKIANDLAAAYYERAQRAGRVDDLPAALDAVERAVQLEPGLLQAWFNRALIVTAMGLSAEAQKAWQAYQQVDASSPWTVEARQHQEELAAGRPQPWQPIADRFTERPLMDAAVQAVSTHASQARALFDTTLEEWTAAARNGRDDPAARVRLRVLGDAFEHVQRERFYQDVAASVDAAVAAGRHRALALAHSAWFEAGVLAAPRGTRAWASAERVYQRAATSLAAAGSPLALRAGVEAATMKSNLLRHDAALADLQPLKTAAQARRYRAIATRAAWITGLSEFGRHDISAAISAYEEMLALAKPPADVDLIVTANFLLASAHYVLGNNRVAWTYRLAAMPLLEQCQSELAISNALLTAAGHAAAAGHVATAFMLESQLQPSTDPGVETQTRIQRASSLHRLGRDDEARLEIQRARQRLALLTDARMIARREADLLVIESELLQATDPRHALRLANQATLWAARTKEPYVVSRIQLRLAEAALAEGDLDRADQAATEAIAQMAILRGTSTTRADTLPSDHELPLYSKAAQIALRRGDFARAFDYVEHRRLRTLYETRDGTAPVAALKDIQQQLDAETALTVLNQIGDQLHIWIITRDDVVVQSADLDASRAAALVSAQWQEIASQTPSPKASGELFDHLFRPVWRHLSRVRTVVVVADAPYNHVAFAGLWDGIRDRYLIEDFRLVSAPTATTFTASLRRALPVSRPTHRLAVLNASAGSSPLPDSHRDIGHDLARLYEGTQLREGASATPSELLYQIGQRDVVHISASVARGGESASGTRLIVANEPGKDYSGSLSVAELASAKGIRTRLVTLDASAADGDDPTSSDGVQEVTRALLAAGVSTVVGRVVAFQAADIGGTWVEFHKQYAAGVAPAESLRRAQLAALSASNRRPGPWAMLTVFGSNQ